jgi:hypothetical protein
MIVHIRTYCAEQTAANQTSYELAIGTLHKRILPRKRSQRSITHIIAERPNNLLHLEHFRGIEDDYTLKYDTY